MAGARKYCAPAGCFLSCRSCEMSSRCEVSSSFLVPAAGCTARSGAEAGTWLLCSHGNLTFVPCWFCSFLRAVTQALLSYAKSVICLARKPAFLQVRFILVQGGVNYLQPVAGTPGRALCWVDSEVGMRLNLISCGLSLLGALAASLSCTWLPVCTRLAGT